MSTSPQLSAYVSAFNLLQNGFDYEDALTDMIAFFDEVVVAVNTSEDGTLAALQALAAAPESVGKLRVISTSFRYDDVTFDGAVKNAALQACTQEDAANRVYIQMDMDEIAPLSQRALWRVVAQQLLADPYTQCYMFPSVDLWSSMDTIRADKSIGLKFRMHKSGLSRGVWKHAWVIPGKRFDTSRSDSCELLTPEGDLACAVAVTPFNPITPAVIGLLRDYPHTLHTGYVSYEQRVRVNNAIWAAHWPLRSGHPEKVATKVDELRDVPLVKHGLSLS